MSFEVLENSQTGGEKESPIPALRKDLESIIDPEAQRRLEEYVGRLEEYMRTIEDAALPTEENSGLELPPDSNLEITPDWFLGLTVRGHPNKDDPIELVIDLCSNICQMATASGPFLFPKPDKEKIKEIKTKTGKKKRPLTGALTILERAREISDRYSSSDPSPGEPAPITSSDIKIVEEIHNRAWRWHEYAWEFEKFDFPLPKKKTTRGRPASDHVNALEWRLWQVLQCTGMKKRRACKYIEQLLSFYGLFGRPWESIEQRLIQQEKSSSS